MVFRLILPTLKSRDISYSLHVPTQKIIATYTEEYELFLLGVIVWNGARKPLKWLLVNEGALIPKLKLGENERVESLATRLGELADSLLTSE